DLLQLFVDRVADQDERPEPDAFRVLGRRLQRHLLDRNGSTWIAVIETLRAGEIEGGTGDRQITGVLVPGGLNLRLGQERKEFCDAGVFGRWPVAQHPQG